MEIKENNVTYRLYPDNPQRKKEVLRGVGAVLAVPTVGCGLLSIFAPEGVKAAFDIVSSTWQSVEHALANGNVTLGVVGVGVLGFAFGVGRMLVNGAIADYVPVGEKRTYVSRLSFFKDKVEQMDIDGPKFKWTGIKWKRFSDLDGLVHANDYVEVENAAVAGKTSSGRDVRLPIKNIPVNTSWRIENGLEAQTVKFPKEWGTGEEAYKMAIDRVVDKATTSVIEYGTQMGELTPESVLDQKARGFIEKVFAKAFDLYNKPRVMRTEQGQITLPAIRELPYEGRLEAVQVLASAGEGTRDELSNRALAAALESYVALPGPRFYKPHGFEKLEVPDSVGGQIERIAAAQVENDFWGGVDKVMAAQTLQGVTRYLNSKGGSLVNLQGLPQTVEELMKPFGNGNDSHVVVEEVKKKKKSKKEKEKSAGVYSQDNLDTAITSADFLKRRGPKWFTGK